MFTNKNHPDRHGPEPSSNDPDAQPHSPSTPLPDTQRQSPSAPLPDTQPLSPSTPLPDTQRQSPSANDSDTQPLSPSAWEAPYAGRPPSPLPVALLLAPLLLLWTLPQTLVGLLTCLLRCLQGHRPRLYRFGPFVFLVTRARGPLSSGISLGLCIFSSTPDILKHEFCHMFTALWLAWLYLPVYGIEYATFGHDRSPHERLTCWIEQRIQWAYQTL